MTILEFKGIAGIEREIAETYLFARLLREVRALRKYKEDPGAGHVQFALCLFRMAKTSMRMKQLD